MRMGARECEDWKDHPGAKHAEAEEELTQNGLPPIASLQLHETSKKPFPDLSVPPKTRVPTLEGLPVELHKAIFERLDVIDSTCLGLTNKRFYNIHRSLHGTVPLATRRDGLNYVEQAWQTSAGFGSISSLMAGMAAAVSIALVLPATMAPTTGNMVGRFNLGKVRTRVRAPCTTCSFLRCELHKHIKDWFGKEFEYCTVREKFVSLAEEEAPELCCGNSPDDDCVCIRHQRGSLKDRHLDQNSVPPDAISRITNRPRPPSPETQSQTSSVAMSESNGSVESRNFSGASDNEESQDAVSRADKSAIIEKVMTWFKIWLESRLALLTYQCEGSSAAGHSSSPSNPQDGNEENGAVSQKGRSGKHDRGDSGAESADEDSGDGEDRKGSKRAKPDSTQKRKFACPFYKHDKRSYQSWRVCSGPGWDSVHRVK